MGAFDLLLNYEFVQRAVLAAVLVAIVTGTLGVYVVLRGLSLLGDGLAHISFAGVALGLAAGVYPLGAAFAFAVGGALLIHLLRVKGIVRGDTAIGILFTAGLALGILLVSRQGGVGVNLSAYLFGSILEVGSRDLFLVGGLALGLLALFLLLQKEFFYVTFNEEAARLSGLPVAALDVVFTVVAAASIVAAARIVGVLLVSALLIAPAATSLQFARSFRMAVLLSVLLAVASAVTGVLAAAELGYATGATIALVSTGLFGAAVMLRVTLARRAG